MRGRCGLHQQGAGRRGLPLLAARDRSDLSDRTHDGRAGAEGRRRQGRDPAPQLRQGREFPYTTSFGWTLDSGNYQAALEKVLKAVDYDSLRREQAAKRADPDCPTLMGIGISTFTEIVGAGPTKVCDILGIGLFDSCEIRVHPTGAESRAWARCRRAGACTTYAQIIATELGLLASDIVVEEGDTDKAPYGAAPGARARRRFPAPRLRRQHARSRTRHKDCRASARGRRRRPRMGDRPLQGQGQSEPGQDHEGDLHGR